MSNSITSENLCLWYSETQALKGISMEIPENSITALLNKRFYYYVRSG